jgi:chaperonin GroES
MNINPLGDVVIIRRSAPAEVSAGGIHLVWDEDYKEDIGTVVYVGKGIRHKCHFCKHETNVPTNVQPGDKVLFSTNGHQITTIDGEELVILREKSIIGVIQGDNVESGTRKADREYAGIE